MFFTPSRNKSGQGNASGAAILVVIIGILLVVYILTLAPADRDALLAGSNGGVGGSGGAGGYGGRHKSRA